MTLYVPTGSKLETVDACLGAGLYDDGIDETSPALEGGISVHAFLEDLNREDGDVDAVLKKIEDPAAREVCAAIELAGLPLDPKQWAPEVTLAWNWRTGRGRELGRGLKRDYSGRDPDEFVLTVDAVALLGTDGVFVIDWKTGYGRLRAARAHAQLRMGALAACAAYGRDRAMVEIIRPREGQRAWRDRAELDAFDLAEVAEERRGMGARIRHHEETGEAPRLRVGAHCERCSGRWSCRARTVELVALGSDPAAIIEREVTRRLTPELARAAYERYRAYEAAMAPVKKAIRAFAIDHPIELEDGFVYGPREIQKPLIDGRVAWDELEEAHGREVAGAAVEIKTSKSAIKDALRPVAPKRGLTKLFEQTFARLEAKGAVTKKTEIRVEEHRPRDGGDDDE